MTADSLRSSRERKAAVVGSAPAGSDADATPLMLLRVGDRWFALDVHAVVEVALKGTITRVPTAPHHILGITSLRGRLVTVVSIEQMLDGGGLPSTDRPAALPRLVVVRQGEYEIGLVAEAIHGIGRHRLAPHSDDTAAAGRPAFVRDEFLWQTQQVALLDVAQLLATAATLSGIHSTSDGGEA